MSGTNVYWGVAPGNLNNRPAALIRELRALRELEEVAFIYHGRAPVAPGWSRAFLLRPGLRARVEPDRYGICLSPVFPHGLQRDCAWVDFYDDWSCAPDINPLYRRFSWASYKRASALIESGVVVTCNTEYMARKLGIPLANVIPNGVESGVALTQTTGDDSRRLVVQGHFFVGRTDFSLLSKVAGLGLFDEVVICAPGATMAMRRVIEELRKKRDVQLRVLEWVSDVDLARIIGKNTVALIPHVVSDYTLSQDLMKVYKYLALGMRVICPRLLWPSVLGPACRVAFDAAFLTDYGLDLEVAIDDWLRSSSNLNAEQRAEFAVKHSWERRAMTLVEVWCA